MTAEEIKEIAKIAAIEAIEEMENRKKIVENEKIAYELMAYKLKEYFGGRVKNEKLEKILKEKEQDQYYTILPLFFGKNKTVTAISLELYCGYATTMRNKKRLVMEIYEEYYRG